MTAVGDLMFFLNPARWLLSCINLQLQLSQSVSSVCRQEEHVTMIYILEVCPFDTLFYSSVWFPRGQDRKQRLNLLHLPLSWTIFHRVLTFPQSSYETQKLLGRMTAVPTQMTRLGPGPRTPKEGHQWTEPSIHHATPRPATPTTAPSTPTATPTGFNTAHIQSFCWCLIFGISG